MARSSFKTVKGSFGSAQWRRGNAARMAGTARAAALTARRQTRRSGYSLARRIALNRERKFLDTIVTTLPFDSDNLATSTVALNVVPIGDSTNTRIGKKISLKAVQIKGAISCGEESNVSASLLLVYDRNPNQQAALPLPADVLTITSLASGGAGLTNRDWSERFKIVRRWDYVVTSGDSATHAYAAGYPAGGSVIPVDEYVDLKGRVTEWTAGNSTGAVAAMVKGSLFLLAIANNANGPQTPTFSGATRIDYED